MSEYSSWSSLEWKFMAARQHAHYWSRGRRPSISPLDVRNGRTNGGTRWRTPQQPSMPCLKGRGAARRWPWGCSLCSAAAVLFTGQKMERKSGGDKSAGSGGDKVGAQWTWTVLRPREREEEPAMAEQELLLPPNQWRKEAEQDRRQQKRPHCSASKLHLHCSNWCANFCAWGEGHILQVSFW
jgi:hypothetical protein